ncbi:unnamed protein product [Cyprideis torosa]|uniref:Uncharacterized protein n=1 Tax=Cyprideis torosa TaxID=163714 RepID=A0A7R8WC18_9CRUS|nr:unnamed protein product [Cyprideis torosa]CAG0891527.1 unnamed protein product [Cyprideis torosa]
MLRGEENNSLPQAGASPALGADVPYLADVPYVTVRGGLAIVARSCELADWRSGGLAQSGGPAALPYSGHGANMPLRIPRILITRSYKSILHPAPRRERQEPPPAQESLLLQNRQERPAKSAKKNVVKRCGKRERERDKRKIRELEDESKQSLPSPVPRSSSRSSSLGCSRILTVTSHPITPEQIRPFPLLQVAERKTGRKKGSSKILTKTPDVTPTKETAKSASTNAAADNIRRALVLQVNDVDESDASSDSDEISLESDDPDLEDLDCDESEEENLGMISTGDFVVVAVLIGASVITKTFVAQLFYSNCSEPVLTVVESEENEVEDMEDVIEDLDGEKNVEVIQGTSEYEDAITVRRAMPQSDTMVDQSETLIGKDFIEDLDVKQAVEQLERTPKSQNRLNIARTILKPEDVKEHGCHSDTMNNHIDNEIEKEPIEDLDLKNDVVEQRVHPGEKHAVCQRSFSDSSTLVQHRMIHTGEKHHGCPSSKSFSRASNLAVHRSVHTVDKPLSVASDKSFYVVSDLVEHRIYGCWKKPH